MPEYGKRTQEFARFTELDKSRYLSQLEPYLKNSASEKIIPQSEFLNDLAYCRDHDNHWFAISYIWLSKKMTIIDYLSTLITYCTAKMFGTEFGRVTAFYSRNYSRKISNIPDFDKVALDLYNYCTRFHVITPFNYLATISSMGGEFFLLKDRVKIILSRFVDVISCQNYVPLITPQHCELFYVLGMDFQFAVYNFDIVLKMGARTVDNLDAHNDCCDASYIYMTLVCNKQKTLPISRDYKVEEYLPTEGTRFRVMETVKVCAHYDHVYAYLPPIEEVNYYHHVPKSNTVTIASTKYYGVGTWCVAGTYYARSAHNYEDFSTMYNPRVINESLRAYILTEFYVEPFYEIAPLPLDFYNVKAIQSIAGLIIVNSPFESLSAVKGYFEWRMLSFVRLFESYLKICCEVGTFCQIKFNSYALRKDDNFMLSKTGTSLVSVPFFFFDLFNDTTRVQDLKTGFSSITTFNILKNIYSYRKSYILAPLAPHFAHLHHNGYRITDATEFAMVLDSPLPGTNLGAPSVGICIAADAKGKAIHCGACRKFGCPFNNIEDFQGKMFTHLFDQRYKKAPFPWACLLSMIISDYKLYPDYCDKDINHLGVYAAKSVGKKY
jgi:hypothetical protein